jgi:3-oxoacyl-[acyl-carrier protein] reductase
MAPKVRVNAVCPGPIDSRWIREGNPDWDLNQMVADFPIPRAASPADVADTVLYFALGTTLTTGQLLALEGGMLLKT